MLDKLRNAAGSLSQVTNLLPLFHAANAERLATTRSRIAAIDVELAELARAEREAAIGLISAAGITPPGPNDHGLLGLLNGGQGS